MKNDVRNNRDIVVGTLREKAPPILAEAEHDRSTGGNDPEETFEFQARPFYEKLGYQLFMALNHLHPPFDNKAVRQAVMRGMKQDEFLNAMTKAGRYQRDVY